MRRRPLLALALGFLVLSPAGPALASDCLEQYFAPADAGGASPLPRPHRELAGFLRGARAGVASARRSLAVSYETGYLVSRCEAKAKYWYGKAAQAGDEAAKAWLRRQAAFARLHAGPECAGSQCAGSGSIDNRVATFLAGQGGHFFAPVTINGVTVRGLIDTGASNIAMSEETARRFGLDLRAGSKGVANTANGQIANTNLVLPLVTVGDISLSDVRVSVGITGELLIGMSFLGRLNIQMAAGQLQLSQ